MFRQRVKCPALDKAQRTQKAQRSQRIQLTGYYGLKPLRLCALRSLRYFQGVDFVSGAFFSVCTNILM